MNIKIYPAVIFLEQSNCID